MKLADKVLDTAGVARLYLGVGWPVKPCVRCGRPFGVRRDNDAGWICRECDKIRDREEYAKAHPGVPR